MNKKLSALSEQTDNKNLLDFAGFAPVFKSDNKYAIATQRDGFAGKYGSDTTYLEPLRGQQYFRELPNSEEEVTQIASLFKQANRTAVTYTYGQSTKTAFKNEGPRYNILHIATHAFANNKEPELSWLAFANKDSTLTNTQNDDGVLYAGEIYGLSLNAGLIVLSACETGVGKVIKGEGIMSLSRSLMYAGVSNIILSLWRVGDLDSKVLMIEFYKANISGKSYADALRTAKLSMLKKKSSPKSWAGFVLFGI
jgi:CHAT domain-containing protein